MNGGRIFVRVSDEQTYDTLHESEENCLFSDLLFYDNTDDTELAANKIVFIALELLKDVKEAMEIDLD